MNIMLLILSYDLLTWLVEIDVIGNWLCNII